MSSSDLIPTNGGGWGANITRPDISPGEPAGTIKAFCRWVDVSCTVVSGTVTIGVVAFHINGIASVEFAVNGGDFIAVTDWSYNPRTETWEYNAALDTTAWPDGTILDVRAVANPVAGKPRIMQPDWPASQIPQPDMDGTHRLHLVVDNGTLSRPVKWVATNGNDGNPGTEGSPVATIREAVTKIISENGNPDNAIVYLKAGTHAWTGKSGSSTSVGFPGWLTVTAAPGLGPGDVTIVSTGSGQWLQLNMVKLLNVGVNGSIDQTTTGNHAIWADNCDLFSGSSTNADGMNDQFTYDNRWDAGIFITNSSIHRMHAGNTNYCSMFRGCHIYDIGEDYMQQPSFVLNCKVAAAPDGVPGNPGGPETHQDLIQYFSVTGAARDNLIYCNILAYNLTAQAIQVTGGNGFTSAVAFVNWMVFLDGRANSEQNGWNNNYYLPDLEANHILMWNCTLAGINDDGTSSPWRYEGTWPQSNVSTIGCYGENVDWCTEAGIGGLYIYRDLYAGDSTNPGIFFGKTFNGTEIEPYGPGLGNHGNPGFMANWSELWVDPLNFDFTLAPNSPLIGKVADPPVPFDVYNNARGNPTAIGAVADLSEVPVAGAIIPTGEGWTPFPDIYSDDVGNPGDPGHGTTPIARWTRPSYEGLE